MPWLAKLIEVNIAPTGAVNVNEVFSTDVPQTVPEALPTRPMAVLLFDHINVVPLTGPVGVTLATVTPLQYTAFEIALTVGNGLTDVAIVA